MDAALAAELIRRHLFAQPASHGLRDRLYLALRQAILGAELAPGTVVPPSRLLALELDAGRSTVVRVYERLIAEGYLAGATGSGTRVSDALPRSGTPSRPGARTPDTPVRLSRRGARIDALAASSPLQGGAFAPGVPDVAHFPFALWRRLVARHTRYEERQMAQYGFGGYGPLKLALAEYLRVTRMMSVQPQQVLILNGSHQAIDLCARMLCDEGDRVWMEDPGYWGARTVLSACGLQIDPVPVDQDGLAPPDDAGPRAPRLVFVSPSSQYPTGVVLSLERRLRLLEQVRRIGAWIIEDDYDNELRQEPHSLGSLFGLDGSRRVLYVGTFSKVMYPGLRLAYLVVPENLVVPFARGNADLYREGRLFEQAAMAEFIDGGHFTRHLRRMRGIYAERRETLREAVAARLGGLAVTHGGQAGLQLLYRFTQPVDDVSLASRALRDGVVLRPLSMYYLDAARRTSGLNLGFAAVPVDRIESAMTLVARALDSELGRPR